VKRFLTGDSTTTTLLHHFLSSPVHGQDIQPGFVSDPPDTSIIFSKFDEPSATWISAMTATGSWNTSFENQFINGKGYQFAVPAGITKTFIGPLNRGTFTLSCDFTAASGASGWNLLGNPYPSALNWDAVIQKMGVDKALYYYDPGIQNFRDTIHSFDAGIYGSCRAGRRLCNLRRFPTGSFIFRYLLQGKGDRAGNAGTRS
jgi:hypothetical protein